MDVCIGGCSGGDARPQCVGQDGARSGAEPVDERRLTRKCRFPEGLDGKRPKLTFGLFLFYAFTPLPSNFVFIAYGLTTMHLARLAIPFFLGRFVSYAFWTLSAAAVSRRFDFDDGKTLSYFSVYLVLTQSALLGTVYLFTWLDWKMLLREHKWKLVKRS